MKKKKILLIVIAVLLVALAVAVPCVLLSWGILPVVPAEVVPQEGDVRIACVGDSITFGMLVWGWPKKNYPAKLGHYMGKGYTVNNYGCSGATASPVGDQPYVEEQVYSLSLEFQPNIVVIMLGSNDSKPHNWTNMEDYKRYYGELIDTYLALDSVEQVFIMTPPPVFPVGGKVGYGINGDLIKGEINQAVRALASEKGLQLIDLYSVFEGHPELFDDGLHPNAEGATLLAQTVGEAIQQYVEGK
ncbi:MAG: hypothetical protein IJX70_05970 [Clostridia bacterium]|nr:hypothetical protein [Clostridia bacterium]